MKRNVGGGSERENRFPFSSARLLLAQRSLISSSPNSTAAASFFFYLSSPFVPSLYPLALFATPPHRNVHHVLFRSGDQHCYGSVLRPVLRSSPLALATFRFHPISRSPREKAMEREGDSVLLIILVLALFRLVAMGALARQRIFEFEDTRSKNGMRNAQGAIERNLLSRISSRYVLCIFYIIYVSVFYSYFSFLCSLKRYL